MTDHVQTSVDRDFDGGLRTTQDVVQGSNPTAANANVVLMRWITNDATPSVTDTLLNTYTQILKVWNGGDSIGYAAFIAHNIAGGGANTVRTTYSGSIEFPRMFVIELSGAHLTSAVDDYAAQFTTHNTGADAVTSGDLDTTESNVFLVGGLFLNGNQVITAGTGWTERYLGSDPARDQVQTRNQVAAGTTSGLWTIDGSRLGVAMCIAIKGAAAAGGNPHWYFNRMKRRRAA